MEHSWRPLPSLPIQGNICPTCSIPHFPFCPPPYLLPFNQNPEFLTHDNSPSFQRPLLDPFLGHAAPNVNLHRPFLENPDDLFVDPRPWHRNPSCEDSGRFNEGHGDGLASYRYDRTGTGFKRTRVDEMGRVSFVNDYPMNLPPISNDNERILKLIRDHGGLASDRETEAYLQENTGSDRAFGSIGGVETGRFNELRGDINGMTLKPPTNYEMNDFRGPRFGNFDKNGSYFHAEPVFNAHKHVEEHGLASGQENFRSSRDNEELGKSQYGHANGHIHIRQGSDYHEGAIRHNSKMGGSYSPSVAYSSALHHQRGSIFSTENHDPNHHLSHAYVIQNPVQLNHNIHSDGQVNDSRGNKYFNEQDGCVSSPSNNRIPVHATRMINVQPPLPDSPSPPLPVVPSSHLFIEHHALSSPALTATSLFPIAVSSAATVPSPYASVAEANSVEFRNSSRSKYLGQDQSLPLKSSDKPTSVVASHLFKPKSFDASHIFNPKSVDASHIFKHPHRATRPDRIVIILRGLPGSGKSYLAKMLRDLEVENGGDAPRIHSMDEYFMTEIEKLEESDVSKSSSSVRGKKPVLKMVMEYCYEPEMEEAYRSSMLKAFKKTLDEGAFSFVLVDDRNLRVADFAQFWAIAKRSGYEVYLAESPYKDPVGCAARNVHGFTRDAIEKMAGLWEEVPSLYLKLDTKSLFQGDDLKESGIQEVDMDTEDEHSARVLSSLEEKNEITELPLHDKKWESEGEHLKEEVKELCRSKWSRDLDDSNAKRSEATKGNLTSLSRLIKAYAMEGKSVHWGDQVGNTGFSIGVSRQVYASLVIGPGAGYNLISNPLREEHGLVHRTAECKGQNVFQERIRAERESFRAVFDKKRDRICGVEV